MKYHRWLLDAFDARLEADYEVEIDIQSDDACSLIEQAKEFLSAAQRFLASPQ